MLMMINDMSCILAMMGIVSVVAPDQRAAPAKRGQGIEGHGAARFWRLWLSRDGWHDSL